ncbi:type I-E CRISPR-associated protein Cas7/Cse4/CasC [Propionibacteriaceae bacterium G57]|uniref:type I-E CRISPR-associated protein Cas7/Cse4/CasC n=1 Tax=Aestuariimicrobium sp. G57 TaxID=3418485 RepID=UPI003DA753FD
MTKFLEVHVIQSLPPSNINRDDTGAPKSGVYGGANRLRVSSQAWKRATRLQFADEIAESQRATRTKRIVRLVSDAIMARGVEDEQRAASLATEVLKAAGVTPKKPRSKDDATISEADYEAEALFFISNQQVQALAEVAVADPDKVDKTAAKNAIDTSHGIEIALFGRMVASSPDLNVDASLQVAHAISTHTVDPQGDFYTAVDDQKRRNDDDAGAGMVGTIEFSSATLYRYAALSLDLLSENLGQATEVTADAAAQFVKAFTLSLPSGKKNSMAADTLPSMVLVTLRESRPVNLVGAFERPVPVSDEGFVARSVAALVRRAQDLDATFGTAPLKTWVVAESEVSAEASSLGDLTSLPQAISSIRETVLAELSEDAS